MLPEKLLIMDIEGHESTTIDGATGPLGSRHELQLIATDGTMFYSWCFPLYYGFFCDLAAASTSSALMTVSDGFTSPSQRLVVS